MRFRLPHSPPENAWRALPLIRLMVGAVFLSEGLQKFIYPALRGPGRFADIGFPNPAFFGYFVGLFEVAAGALLLLGFLTRLAALAMAVNMTVALVVTKLPVLLGRGFGPFGVRDLDTYGFWAMAHEMRTDWAMLLGALLLLIAGAGPWSLDARLARRSSSSSPSLPSHG